MAAGGDNYPGKLLLLGQLPFVIAFKSKSGSLCNCLNDSIVYMLQIWQMLDKSQMFTVCVCMYCFHG